MGIFNVITGLFSVSCKLGHKKDPQIEGLIGERKYINGNLE